MNPPLPGTPPTIMGSINAAGKEIADVGQGVKNAGSQIKSNLKAGQAAPYNARTTINPMRGVGTAFRAAFKK